MCNSVWLFGLGGGQGEVVSFIESGALNFKVIYELYVFSGDELIFECHHRGWCSASHLL